MVAVPLLDYCGIFLPGWARGDRGRGVGCRFSEVLDVTRDTFVNNLDYRWRSGAGVVGVQTLSAVRFCFVGASVT